MLTCLSRGLSLDGQLHALFKACGGKKDGKIPRAKFLKLFTQKVEADGEPLAVKDVEALFNAASIDYDYDTFSLHEFMSLMIVIKGTDAEKKLKFSFAMYDTDSSGYLKGDEIRVMLNALMATKKESEKPQKIDALVTGLMKKDTDRDGQISFEELKRALTDEGWMEKHLGKGASIKSVADTAFANKSSLCLVM